MAPYCKPLQHTQVLCYRGACVRIKGTKATLGVHFFGRSNSKVQEHLRLFQVLRTRRRCTSGNECNLPLYVHTDWFFSTLLVGSDRSTYSCGVHVKLHDWMLEPHQSGRTYPLSVMNSGTKAKEGLRPKCPRNELWKWISFPFSPSRTEQMNNHRPTVPLLLLSPSLTFSLIRDRVRRGSLLISHA